MNEYDILYCIPPWSAHVYMTVMYHTLKQSGYSVKVLGGMRLFDESDRLYIPKYPNYPLHLGRSLPRQLAKWFASEWREWRYRGNVKKWRARLHLEEGCCDALFRDLGYKPNGPRCLTLQASPRCYDGNIVRYPWGDRDEIIKTMRKYDYLLFVSERVRAHWLRLMDYPPERAFCLWNTVRENEASAIRQEAKMVVRKRLGMPSDAVVMSCVASVQYRKGQDILIKQLGRLKHKLPSFRLYLVGPVVPEWGGNDIVATIEENGLQDCIKCVGMCENALEYTYASDALILPTRAEALPLCILEAMALGTPVIASDVDGIPEMIENGVSGQLFDVDNNQDGLGDAILELMENPALGKTFAVEAEKVYWAKLSQACQVEGWKRILGVMLK